MSLNWQVSEERRSLENEETELRASAWALPYCYLAWRNAEGVFALEREAESGHTLRKDSFSSLGDAILQCEQWSLERSPTSFPSPSRTAGALPREAQIPSESERRELDAAMASLDAALLSADAELARVIECLPFSRQVEWHRAIGVARLRAAERVRSLRYCPECGCLLMEGHLPDCAERFYPRALTLRREEAGILD